MARNYDSRCHLGGVAAFALMVVCVPAANAACDRVAKVDSFTWKQKVEQSGVRPADVATQIRAALKARGSKGADAQVAEIAEQIVATINDKVSNGPTRFSACARDGRTCVNVTCE